jgi:hypothetical protein
LSFDSFRTDECNAPRMIKLNISLRRLSRGRPTVSECALAVAIILAFAVSCYFERHPPELGYQPAPAPAR